MDASVFQTKKEKAYMRHKEQAYSVNQIRMDGVAVHHEPVGRNGNEQGCKNPPDTATNGRFRQYPQDNGARRRNAGTKEKSTTGYRKYGKNNRNE